METKANYVLIGMFTLAVIAGVFGFVYWFQNIGGTGEKVSYRVVFDGSVSGLRTGANVLFNGILVGNVSNVTLDPKHPKEVLATISINKDVQIHSDVEVGLEFQGLTGVAQVSLKGGTLDSPILAGSRTNPPTLQAPSAAAMDLTQAARDALQRLDNFVAANQDTFKDALKNIDEFTKALARNSSRVDKITEGLQKLAGGEDGNSGQISEVVGQVGDAVKSYKTLAENLDKRTAEITVNLNRLLVNGNKQVETVGNDLHRTLGTIDTAVKNFDKNPSRLIFGGSGGDR
jgi:phospholipid/cholesterol/gamma-HCH transport system substrate-binding protein